MPKTSSPPDNFAAKTTRLSVKPIRCLLVVGQPTCCLQWSIPDVAAGLQVRWMASDVRLFLSKRASNP